MPLGGDGQHRLDEPVLVRDRDGAQVEQAAAAAHPGDDPAQAQAQVRFAFALIRLYAVLSAPFIPFTAGAMMQALGCEDWSWPDDLHQAMQALPPRQSFTVPENLFAKITDAQREDWQARFGGVRA